MTFKAFISGCAGASLSDAERQFFGRERPCGLILFARNCQTPEQISALVTSFKDAVESEEALVLIDQEGGRVQRLRPPHWRSMPPARCYGVLYETAPEVAKKAAFSGARLIAEELRGVGINVNCTPCIDVPEEGAHDVIGDRAFSTDSDVVIALGRAVMDGTLAGGALPVIKHVPGHGRARADSHLSLPRIDATRAELEARDFRPFEALRDSPLAMTAHVLLPAYDERRPATTSPVIMREVIRDLIGLNGLVMSDDIGMQALGGSFAERTRGVIDAGCDVVLQCSGVLSEMLDTGSAAPLLDGLAAERFARARAALHDPRPFDVAEALALVHEADGTRVAGVGADPTVRA
ncbi:MAG: beta-N-acetylhexosaminidase [Alphaproteobacteria bacterium]|nr:beta-N-acetylhexosaminidase [Alphaproteobacteria bacterium]